MTEDTPVFCFKFVLVTPVVTPDAADKLLEWLSPEVEIRGYKHKVIGVCAMTFDTLYRTSSFTVVTMSDALDETISALRWPTQPFARAMHAALSPRQLVEEDPRKVSQRVQQPRRYDLHRKLVGTRCLFSETPFHSTT